MSLTTRLAVTLALVILAASCGVSQSLEVTSATRGEAGAESPGAVESCNDVADLRIGLPLFDYDRHEDLTDLVAAVDVVVQGTLRSATWTPTEGDDPEAGAIVITVSEFGPLTPASPELAEEVQFEIGAVGIGDDDHPLAVPHEFPAQTQFVAFADITDGDPSRLQLHPQGLYLRCPTSDAAAESEVESILEPLPADAGDLAFFELVDTISAVAPPKPPRPVGEQVQIDYRVLADGLDTGEPWTVQVISDSETLRQLTADIDASVDFQNDVVFAINPAESGSCPFGPVERIEFDTLNRVLYPVVPLADDFQFCTSDANPHLIVVAIGKADLPEAPFDVWVDDREPPAGVVDGVATYLGDD